MANAIDAILIDFIVIGNNRGWGRGPDEKTAVHNMHKAGGGDGKATEWMIYRATRGTYVNDMGGLNRPAGDPAAVLIRRHNAKHQAELNREARRLLG